jgi:hypothetical protein
MICPQCSKPMASTYAKRFVCEPCRDFIILLTVTSRFRPPWSLWIERT